MSFSNATQDQQLAIDLSLDTANRLVGITGAAGTGKTTVLGEAISEAKDAGYSVAVAAPTGRAAARIKEKSGHYAQTVHRLLGYGAPDPNDPNDMPIPKRGRSNPIPADFIFIDEASMLSDELHRNLVQAVRPGAVLRYFGDMNQLPPVEGTSKFQMVLDKFPSVTLQHNFRSGDGIIQASQSILKGLLPVTNDQVSILNIGSRLGLTTLSEFIDEEFLTDQAQIILPTRVGQLGTNLVNRYIQQKLNTNPRHLDLVYEAKGQDPEQKLRLRPGDKIIWTKNDYNLNLFNGMIGRVVNFDEFEGSIVLEFYGQDKVIPTVLERYDAQNDRKIFRYDPRRYIDLAYAITTHKSQGSEFQRVLMLLYRTRVASRQNFYTAITRARKHVTVIAGPGGLRSAMQLQRQSQEE